MELLSSHYKMSEEIKVLLQLSTISCILEPNGESKGGLYLGNILAAYDAAILNKYQIEAIVTVMNNSQLSLADKLIEHLTIYIHDLPFCNISYHFQQINAFIKTHLLQKKNVLVHCFAGSSRSVTAVIAFLIMEHGLVFDKAYQFVKERRPESNPNKGFTAQLMNIEKELLPKTRIIIRQPENLFAFPIRPLDPNTLELRNKI